jgi:hypothetical protein
MHCCHYISQLYWFLLLVLVKLQEILRVNVITQLMSLWTAKTVPPVCVCMCVCVCVCVCVCARARFVKRSRRKSISDKVGAIRIMTLGELRLRLSHALSAISECGDASLLSSSVCFAGRKLIVISWFKDVCPLSHYFFLPALLFSFIHLSIHSCMHSFILSSFPSFLPSFPTLIAFFLFLAFIYHLVPSPVLLSPSVPIFI